MKKLFTFLLALMASSCLWASITYELNGGKHNDYEWKYKGDMYKAILKDINDITPPTQSGTNVNTITLEEDKTKAVSKGIPTYWSELTVLLTHAGFNEKWGWLIDYMDAACSAQSKSLASSSSTYLRYNLGAFFIESNASTYLHAVYDVLGKDAAYLPAWGQNYGNPTAPTEEVTLVAPYRTGYLFDGWYASADFSGEKVTTVDQNTTGTLYAKWVPDGIVYELNGGKYNDYGWTCKADICLALEADYNTAAGASKDWVKKEDGVIKYNINGVWKTEAEAKGSAANIAGFIHNNTWTADGKFSTLILTTQVDKYGWLKDMIAANREAQSIITGLNDAAYRQEVSAFFLCSPTLTLSGVTSSSYESTGDYEDYQRYWGQAFPNPEHPTAEVVLNNPVKEGYQFGGWYKEADFSGTPITIVDQNFKGTLYAKWTQSGIVYELNGGVWNQYGWERKDDMYSDILKDINNITPPTQRGTDVNTITLAEDKTKAVNKGIPTYWSDLTVLFTHAGFNEKWGWLITYMDEVCEAQGKDKPSSGSTALRYNLGAFFVESDAATYLHAQYGTLGKDAAYIPAWGQSYGNPEHPTEEVTLVAPYKPRYNFEGWYDNAECTGAAITTVDQTYAGTLYAKWSIAPITYNLNGGQYNQYGWKSKKDVYDDFIADWNTYSGTTRKTAQYEDQLGVGKSSIGIPTTITTVNGVNHRENLAAMFTNPTYSAKWGWLVTYIDAVAEQQGKTLLTTNGGTLTFSLGNFFGEDKNSNYSAVDFTGDERYLVSAQLYCSFTLPNPTYPTSEVTINNPTKEGYIFDGWYANADFSGAKVTKVNADTKGTLYAKWTENVIIIDENADNTTALTSFEGQTVTAKVTRAFSNDSYKTLTLPFSMDAPQIQAVFGDAKVYEFTKVVEGSDALHLQFEPTTSILAGTPYIIDLPDGDYDAKDGFTIENVTINTTLNSVKKGVITMEPVLNGGGRLDEAGQYWLSADNYLYNAGNYPTALLGLRAYFTSSSPMPIRARVVFDENQATSIPVVVTPENNVRKVMKNGQLIIIRGEQKYNVQGQRME